MEPNTSPTSALDPQRGNTFDVPGGRGPRFKNRMRSQRSNVGRIVTTLLCGMILVALVIVTAMWGGKQWGAMGFVNAPGNGVVIQSKVVAVSDRNLGNVFETRVRFSYDIDGTAYVSNALSREVLYWFAKPQAERIALRFREGHSVPVYYDAGAPEHAIVEKRVLVEHAPTMLLVPPFLMLLLGRAAGPVVSMLRANSDPSRSGVKMDRIAASIARPASGEAASASGGTREQLRVRMPSEDAVRHGRRVALVAVTIVVLLCGLISWFFPGSISLLIVAVLAGACAASGIAAGMRRARMQLQRGRYLLLDPQARTMVVKGRGRDNRDANIELGAHEVEAVVIEDVWRHAWRWDQRINRKRNELMQDNPAITVRLRTGGVIQIAIWHHPRNAPEFGKWLCGALGAIERGELPGQRAAAVVEEKD